MKNWILIRIVVWALIALLMLGILLGGLMGKFNIFNFFDSTWNVGINGYSYKDSELYKTADQFTQADADSIMKESEIGLDVNWITGSVEIVKDKSFGFYEEGVKLPTDDEALRWYFDGDTLHIQFRKTGMYTANPAKKKLFIHVPEADDAFISSLDADLVSANIKIDGVNIGGAKLDNVSGDIQISGCTIPSIDVDMVSGGTRLDCDFNELRFESVSGTLNAKCAGCPSYLSGESVSGDMTLTICSDRSFTAKYDSVSGDLYCDVPTVSDGKKRIKHEGQYEDNSFSGVFEFSTVSGKMSIYGDFN